MNVLDPHSIIRLEGDAIILLDQTRLPGEVVHRRCGTVAALIDAITVLAVRGAPAIGIAGAMGVALAARLAQRDGLPFPAAVLRAADEIEASRPTAVNLAWAVGRARAVLASVPGPPDAVEALAALSASIHDDEVARCVAIGRHGAALVPHGAVVLTQCNAGALATGGYGTALGVVRAAFANGDLGSVVVPETRPLLQGARLTAFELDVERIPYSVVIDNAVASLISRGLIDVAIVGADRIARNGDTANKIGTYSIALACERHGIPLLVAAPSSTIDPLIASGSAIPIEQRGADEVRRFGGARTTPAGAACLNPAFDVTPASLVSAIITEEGVFRHPYDLGHRMP